MRFIVSELHGAEPGQDYDQTIPCDERRDGGRSRLSWPISHDGGGRILRHAVSVLHLSFHGIAAAELVTAFVGGAVGRGGDPCGLRSRLMSATTISAQGVSCRHPAVQFTRVSRRRETDLRRRSRPQDPPVSSQIFPVWW